jgi:5-methylcytosine-specific restriction endonuclease McrA
MTGLVHEAAGTALVVVALAGSAALAAFSTPGGLLSLLVTRRRRYEYRRWLANRRWRKRPRAKQRSARISAHLHAMVERADRRTCVGCGAKWQRGQPKFAVDHMTPWIMGGLTCLANSALLCRTCNTVKSCYWVSPSGREYYRGRGRPPRRAVEIWHAELAARRSVARWLRAFGLLPSW